MFLTEKNSLWWKATYIILQGFDKTIKGAFVTRISHHSRLDLHIHQKEDRTIEISGMEW